MEAIVDMMENGTQKYSGFVLQYVRDLFCQHQTRDSPSVFRVYKQYTHPVIFFAHNPKELTLHF